MNPLVSVLKTTSHASAHAYVRSEQRKTVLRRVEMELDEADEMV